VHFYEKISSKIRFDLTCFDVVDLLVEGAFVVDGFF